MLQPTLQAYFKKMNHLKILLTFCIPKRDISVAEPYAVQIDELLLPCTSLFEMLTIQKLAG